MQNYKEIYERSDPPKDFRWIGAYFTNEKFPLIQFTNRDFKHPKRKQDRAYLKLDFSSSCSEQRFYVICQKFEKTLKNNRLLKELLERKIEFLGDQAIALSLQIGFENFERIIVELDEAFKKVTQEQPITAKIKDLVATINSEKNESDWISHNWAITILYKETNSSEMTEIGYNRLSKPLREISSVSKSIIGIRIESTGICIRFKRNLAYQHWKEFESEVKQINDLFLAEIENLKSEAELAPGFAEYGIEATAKNPKINLFFECPKQFGKLGYHIYNQALDAVFNDPKKLEKKRTDEGFILTLSREDAKFFLDRMDNFQSRFNEILEQAINGINGKPKTNWVDRSVRSSNVAAHK